MVDESERNVDESSDVMRRAAESGGKRSGQDLVESVPSSEDKDPKTHEPRRGDMSEREGDFGKRTPR
jgi:hypothetical protein